MSVLVNKERNMGLELDMVLSQQLDLIRIICRLYCTHIPLSGRSHSYQHFFCEYIPTIIRAKKWKRRKEIRL